MLSDSESEGSDSLHHLTINEHFAKAFEYKKEREELTKLKDKYGSDVDSAEESESDSEEGVTEDEDGEELTPTVDAAILRTLAKIKRKDPEIYEANKSVFEEEQKKTGRPISTSVRAPRDKSKPVTIRQVALEAALNPVSRSPSPQPLPHVEEQRALRSETIAAFHHAVDDSDTESDGFLIPREKTKDEVLREEEEYRAFLEREVGEDLKGLVTIETAEGAVSGTREVEGSPGSKEKHKKRKKKKGEKSVNGQTKPKEEADQEFLMNYILNRGWIDKSARHIPTYKEVTGSKKEKGKTRETVDGGSDIEGSASGSQADDIDLDADEEFEEVNELFETSYNFRFEEPDGGIIKTFPRNLPSLVRREDSSRKEARERRKQRKEEELLKKKEEVRRLKALKMKDIRAKLERIGHEAGKNLDETKALQDLDLEGDWDPDAHDRQMAGLYGDDDDGADAERPQWDSDIDLGDIIPQNDEEEGSSKKSKKKKKKKKKGEEGGEADEGGVDIDAMDADIEQNADDEEWDGTEEMRKRKLDEYMDEIYGLDFNDMVGGMPTRFKYMPVQPQTFALSPAEILMATDKELNEYVSVKKYAPYRKEGRWDATRNERLKALRQKVQERGGAAGAAQEDAGGERPAKKRKGKKERMKLKATADGDGAEVEPGAVAGKLEEPQIGKRKREVQHEDEEAGVKGSTVKKRKRKHKKAAAPTS